MRSLLILALSTTAALMALTGFANAATIQMSPNPASINAVLGSDFNLILNSGDSDTNILNFTVQGAGGCGGLCPSTAIAAIVFDGVSVLEAFDTDGGFFSAGNVVRGFILTDSTVAGLLIDFGQASSEAFSLTLDATPTTATLYALNLDDLSAVQTKDDILSNVKDSTQLKFSVEGQPAAAVPEPSAAMIFAFGLLVAHAGLRRR